MFQHISSFFLVSEVSLSLSFLLFSSSAKDLLTHTNTFLSFLYPTTVCHYTQVFPADTTTTTFILFISDTPFDTHFTREKIVNTHTRSFKEKQKNYRVMKFTTAAAAATTLFGLSLAQVKYEYVKVTNYVTVGADGQATPTETTEEPATSTWVFSTNILGQDIAFTSVVTDPTVANATLYRENLVIQSGDSLTTERLAIIAKPSTLVTSTLTGSETTAESETAYVSFTPTSQTSQATQQSVEATSTSAQQSEAQATTSAPATSSSQAQASASPSSSSSSSSGDFGNVKDESFSQNILDAHNSKRALHGVSALSWDQDAYQYAQDYADQYSCSGNLKHSGGKYGENLGVGYKDGSSVVEAWYDEGNNYDYNTASSFDHFTQVIWKGTTKVGCAYKDCSAENWGKYIICSYDPAGNIIGQGKANLKALV